MLVGLNVGAQAPPAANGVSLGERVAPKPGEICAVCNRPVGAGDDVYIVNGQRVPVHRDSCLAKLQADPGKYVAHLRPAGSFLGLEPDAATALTGRWLAAGLYVLLGLVFAALSANAALNRGLHPTPWFVAGLFFNVLAWGALMARRPARAPAVPRGLSKIPETASPLPCPRCGYPNHPAARACLGCGAELRPDAVSEASRAAAGSVS